MCNYCDFVPFSIKLLSKSQEQLNHILKKINYRFVFNDYAHDKVRTVFKCIQFSTLKVLESLITLVQERMLKWDAFGRVFTAAKQALKWSPSFYKYLSKEVKKMECVCSISMKWSPPAAIAVKFIVPIISYFVKIKIDNM